MVNSSLSLNVCVCVCVREEASNFLCLECILHTPDCSWTLDPLVSNSSAEIVGRHDFTQFSSCFLKAEWTSSLWELVDAIVCLVCICAWMCVCMCLCWCTCTCECDEMVYYRTWNSYIHLDDSWSSRHTCFHSPDTSHYTHLTFEILIVLTKKGD